MPPPINPNTTRCQIPRAACCVSVYHAGILIIFSLWIVFQLAPANVVQTTHHDIPYDIMFLFSFASGMIGGTLQASRYVVWAVRHGRYEVRRVLWQVLTPVHGGVFAIFGLLVVYGGLISLTNVESVKVPGSNGYFIGGLSFVIGFTSEHFVMAMIRAAEAMFGHKDKDPQP